MPHVNRDKEAGLTHERLREVLRYDPDVGEFTWLKSTSNRTPTGSRAGCLGDKGRNARYVILGIDGKLFLAHRVAWFYMTGGWPADEIDHKDGDGWNNRWNNLREADHRQNMRNIKRPTVNKTGVKGVYYYPRHRNKFQAWLTRKYLGSFATLAEAAAVRTAAARAAHGEFYRP